MVLDKSGYNKFSLFKDYYKIKIIYDKVNFTLEN